MDPDLFDKINVFQNLENQKSNEANLRQLKANQSELTALRRQLAEEAHKPQCPHCGGPSEKGFERCKNCGQEVIWCGHFVGKPNDRANLEMAMQQYELGIKQKQEAQNRANAQRHKASIESDKFRNYFFTSNCRHCHFTIYFVRCLNSQKPIISALTIRPHLLPIIDLRICCVLKSLCDHVAALACTWLDARHPLTKHFVL